MALEELTIIVGQLFPGAAGCKRVAQRRNNERLNLGSGNTADQSGRLPLSLQYGLGDVIAVAGAALVGVGWAHAVAAIIEKASAQDGGRAPQPAAPRHCLGRKLALHRLKQRGFENGLMLAAVNLAPVNNFSDIEAVLQQMGERSIANIKGAPTKRYGRAHTNTLPSNGGPIGGRPRIAKNPLPLKLFGKRGDETQRQISPKNRATRRSLGCDHKNLLVHGGIAERNR